MKITIGNETFDYETPNFEKALRDGFEEIRGKKGLTDMTFQKFVMAVFQKGLITLANEISFAEAFGPIIEKIVGGEVSLDPNMPSDDGDDARGEAEGKPGHVDQQTFSA